MKDHIIIGDWKIYFFDGHVRHTPCGVECTRFNRDSRIKNHMLGYKRGDHPCKDGIEIPEMVRLISLSLRPCPS